MRSAILIVSVTLMVGCSTEDGDDVAPACGDGVCSGGETSATCAVDCQSAGACNANPSTCAGETVCLNGSCVAAFGRVYRIVVQSATVPQRDPNGDAWDVPGGLPDPYAVITLNGTVLGTTTAIQDTLTPSWNMAAMASIPAGSTLRVDVFDEDVAADDPIMACEASPVTADLLHGGSAECASAAGTVRFAFVTQ